jgi:tetratricopeptide (TPR) repeat protein
MNDNTVRQLLTTGFKALQDKKLNDAQDMSKRALGLAPLNADANLLQGLIYLEKGDNGKAIEQLEKTLSLDNSKALANRVLGSLLLKENKPDEALLHYQTAVGKGINESSVYVDMAIIEKANRHTDIAIEYLQKALATDPDNVEILHRLAYTHLHAGQKDLVKDTVGKLLSIDPEFYSAYILLVRARTFTDHDALTQNMQNMLAQNSLSDQGKMYLSFALGKVYDDLGEYENAYKVISTANKIKRATIEYSADLNDKQINRRIAKFSKSGIDQATGSDYRDKTPIFVLGMPRSGTSLVEQILASHSAVYGAGELTNLQTAIKNQKNRKLSKESLSRIGQAYIKSIRKLNSKIPHIIDKQPGNFNLIPHIVLALPDAKIIHCVRDPMDVCFSNYKLYFKEGMLMSYDLAEMGSGYLAYQRLMRHWHEIFPGKIYDIQYEKLINNQERETRKLLEYCDLEWSDACLEFHQTERAVQTPSSIQVKQPIYNSSVNSWKNYSKYLDPLKLALSGHIIEAENESLISPNGETYKISDLPEEALTQLQKIKATDHELKQIQQTKALVITARNAYIEALEAALADTDR